MGRPQGRSGQVRKILSPLGFDPRPVQPVASRDNAYIIPALIDTEYSRQAEYSSSFYKTH